MYSRIASTSRSVRSVSKSSAIASNRSTGYSGDWKRTRHGSSPALILCVQLAREPAGCGPDPNAVDVAHLKVARGGPKRFVVDEDTVDDCANGSGPVGLTSPTTEVVEFCGHRPRPRRWEFRTRSSVVRCHGQRRERSPHGSVLGGASTTPVPDGGLVRPCPELGNRRFVLPIIKFTRFIPRVNSGAFALFPL